jgi:hypothetical protein
VSRLERRLLDASMAVVTLSGLAYYVMKTWMRPRDPYSVLGHPFQPYALALHLLAAPALVFVLGLIFREHVMEKLRGGRSVPGRRGGIGLAATAAPMVVSGYALQIASSPGMRSFLSYAHLATGLVFALLFVAHLAATLPRRRAAARLAEPPPAGAPGTPC